MRYSHPACWLTLFGARSSSGKTRGRKESHQTKYWAVQTLLKVTSSSDCRGAGRQSEGRVKTQRLWLGAGRYWLEATYSPEGSAATRLPT